MRLICWLVLSIVFVESLQKKDNRETALPDPKTTEVTEGSGEDSDSSEERTEATTIEKRSSVPILPLDDAGDSDEAIKKSLSRTASRDKTENSTQRESSDLVVLGENSAAETNSQDGETAPQIQIALNEDPSVFKSSLHDGKLREEIEDAITLSPNSGEPTEGGKLQSHKETPLDHGKGGAEVQDHGKLSENLDNEEQLIDGKLGKVVQEASHAAVVPLEETTSTTTVDHNHSETSSAHPTSAQASDSSTTHTHEETSHTQEVSSTDKESTPSSQGTESSHAESITTPVPSSSPSLSTEVTSSASEKSSAASTAANSEDPDKPDPHAMNIDTIDKMDFQTGAEATCQLSEACDQNRTEVQCLGAYCNEVSISIISCNREAALKADNKSSVRYTIPAQWSCGSSDFEPDYQIRNSSVICEGFRYPGDRWILQNSCILRFYLEPRMNSSAFTSKESGSSTSAVAIILILLAVTGMGYFVIQAVILKRRHGHWVPSYCALPLKARMNFRRKRQRNYDEEPVNVHFDMGEEQTSLGKGRIRSYGPQ